MAKLDLNRYVVILRGDAIQVFAKSKAHAAQVALDAIRKRFNDPTIGDIPQAIHQIVR